MNLKSKNGIGRSPKTAHCVLFILTLIVVVICLSLYSFIRNNPKDQEVGEEVDQVEGAGEVERRLAEATVIWQKGVEEREKFEKIDIFYDKYPWGFGRGVSIWDFFYPSFDCPYTVERVGGTGDGGKWICGLKKIAKKKGKCVVYSYGVSYNTHFEEEIVRRTNCSIYLFDHTITIQYVGLPKLYPGRVFIEKVGLGVNDTEDLRTIRSTMKKYNHDFIDIMKIDTEGAEFPIFDNIGKDFPNGIPFGQLQMEIHFPPEGKDGYFKTSIKWLKHLETLGFRPFRNEINLFNAKLIKNHVPNLSEYAFINVKYDNYLLHS